MPDCCRATSPGDKGSAPAGRFIGPADAPDVAMPPLQLQGIGFVTVGGLRGVSSGLGTFGVCGPVTNSSRGNNCCGWPVTPRAVCMLFGGTPRLQSPRCAAIWRGDSGTPRSCDARGVTAGFWIGDLGPVVESFAPLEHVRAHVLPACASAAA